MTGKFQAPKDSPQKDIFSIVHELCYKESAPSKQSRPKKNQFQKHSRSDTQNEVIKNRLHAGAKTRSLTKFPPSLRSRQPHPCSEECCLLIEEHLMVLLSLRCYLLLFNFLNFLPLHFFCLDWTAQISVNEKHLNSLKLLTSSAVLSLSCSTQGVTRLTLRMFKHPISRAGETKGDTQTSRFNKLAIKMRL